MNLNMFAVVSIAFLICGCSGNRAFHDQALAGGSISIAAGYMHHFQRENLTVTITDFDGIQTIYLPGDPRVRASINLYPDPLSSLVVSPEIGVDLTPFSIFSADNVNAFFTGDDSDWWETIVIMDLPQSMALDEATITLSNNYGETVTSIIDIVGTGGQANSFESDAGGSPFFIQDYQFASLERQNHYTVEFSAIGTPYAIQLKLEHDPTTELYLVNPRGDKKNIAWHNHGAVTDVILIPARQTTLDNNKDFKFYVAGVVDNLDIMLGSVQAFDINGSAVSYIVSANITDN